MQQHVKENLFDNQQTYDHVLMFIKVPTRVFSQDVINGFHVL